MQFLAEINLEQVQYELENFLGFDPNTVDSDPAIQEFYV